MNDEELEAYLRKHTLMGQMREVRDAWIVLWHQIAHEVTRSWLKILDTLGM